MPYFWSWSERWDQISVRMRQAWAGRSTRITPHSILLGLTLAIAVSSVVLESFTLFLLAIMQGLVIVQLRSGELKFASKEASPAESTLLDDFRQYLPAAGDVLRFGCRTGMMTYRVLYRLTMCLLVSLSAGLATLSAFVLKQAELWQWTTLQTAGPPLGPVLVTGWIMLTVFLLSSWVAGRWPLLSR